jgi:Helix-turn-helix domain
VAISVTNWVWGHSESSHGARLVLLFIADSMRTDDGWAWPSNKEIGARTRLAQRAVQSAITDLAKLGELEVQYNAGPKGCNRYRVLMTPAKSAPPQNMHPPQNPHPADDAPPQDSYGSASSQEDGPDPAEYAPPAESAPPQNSTPDPAESAPGTIKNRKRRTTKKSAGDSEPREDVERICVHLADRIEANGSKRPNITQTWHREARLLLDADKRTEERVHAAIDWCQDNAFWCGKVMSVPKLREKYDTLRLEAKRERDQLNGHGGNRPQRRGGQSDDLSGEVYGQGRTRI